MKEFNPYQQDKNDHLSYVIDVAYSNWANLYDNVSYVYEENPQLGLCPIPETPKQFRDQPRSHQLLSIDKIYEDAKERIDRIHSMLLSEAVVFMCDEGYDELNNYWPVKYWWFDMNDIKEENAKEAWQNFCMGY